MNILDLTVKLRLAANDTLTSFATTLSEGPYVQVPWKVPAEMCVQSTKQEAGWKDSHL